MYVIKKDGTHDPFNPDKIKVAVTKSAKRVMIDLSEDTKNDIVSYVENRLKGVEGVNISTMHNLVEGALEEFDPKVAKSYRDYRNYKQDFVHMMDKVFEGKNLGQGKGGISNLTHGNITRIDLTQNAVIMALVSHINDEIWR